MWAKEAMAMKNHNETGKYLPGEQVLARIRNGCIEEIASFYCTDWSTVSDYQQYSQLGM